MILDTSAAIAILLHEPETERFLRLIAEADRCLISAANYVEAAIVVDRGSHGAGSRYLDAFMRRSEIAIEAVTEEHAHLARQAYADFGKGRHRAGLNFGDCFAYALSKATGEPLLFKGNDFSKTDVKAATG